MTDKKLTDEEIIKALECLCGGGDSCTECTYHRRYRFGECRKQVAKDALDLITRQQTEIEKLKVENQSLRGAANSLKMHYEEAQAEIERLKEFIVETRRCDKEIKSEARKEFAERLKGKAMQKFDWNEYVEVEDIDNLVKEMVGENNG